jgi:hypothetical protein
MLVMFYKFQIQTIKNKTMKKVFTLLVAATVFVLTANAQDAWVKQKVDVKISVKFPKAPESMNDGMVLRFKDADSTAYTATNVDLAPMGLDSAMLASMAPSEEFAEQFKGSFTAQIPGLEVTKMDITTWKDFNCYDIEGDVAEKKLKMTFKCIFIGSKMYTFVVAQDDKGNAKNKETFFSSIELN